MALSGMNFGPLPMVNKLSRVVARFYSDEGQIETLRGVVGRRLSAREALEPGWLPPRPTISTGKTKFAKRLSRAPRNHRTH